MDRIERYNLDIMQQWNEFKQNLNEYKSNGDVSKVVKLIDIIEQNNIQPEIQLIEGRDWLVFHGVGNTREIRVYPLVTSFCNQFVIEEEIHSKVTDRTITSYSFSFVMGLRLIKESVVNSFVSDGEAEYMLCEGERYFSDCNKSGFQYHGKKLLFKCGKLIYVDGKLINKNSIYLPTDMEVACDREILANVDFKTSEEEYGVYGVHESMLINPDTANGAVVIYDKDDKTSLCFPLFYDEKRLINVHSFISNDLLQFPVIAKCGVDIQELNYDGHSTKELGEFLKKRRTIAKSLVKAEYDTQVTEGLTNAQMLLLKF